jgi:hypothetical protein
VWANNIPVTPGSTYSVGVGWGGSGTGAAGGNSWFISTETMIAFGGSGGTRSEGVGGSWTVASSILPTAGGGVGGSGGWQSWAEGSGDAAGGGGGAAGYTGGPSIHSLMITALVISSPSCSAPKSITSCVSIVLAAVVTILISNRRPCKANPPLHPAAIPPYGCCTTGVPTWSGQADTFAAW